jgi:Retinoblastoma-associated protein B domain/Retinoblastoma-associated protein A domain
LGESSDTSAARPVVIINGQGQSSKKKCALRTIIAPVLNRAMVRIHQDIILQPGRQMHEEYGYDYQPQIPPLCPISVGLEDGHVYIEGDHIDITPDIQLCACVIGLYYHALEAILLDERVRLLFGPTGISFSERQRRLIFSPSFHRALLVCCYTCALKAVGSSSNGSSHNHRKRMLMEVSPMHHDLTIFSLLQTLESGPYTYLKVSESFIRALTPARGGSSVLFGSPILFGLPRILQRHIEHTEVQVLDSVVWARNLHPSVGMGYVGDPDEEDAELSLFQVIGDLKLTLPKNSYWPPESLLPTLPEELENLNMISNDGRIIETTRTTAVITSSTDAAFVSFLFRKLLKIAFARIEAICHALEIPPSFPIVREAWIAFRYLLRQHIDLLFERHLDHLIVCTIFGVCRSIMGLAGNITFARVHDVYVSVRGLELGERSCIRIMRYVKLLSNEEMDQQQLAKNREAARMAPQSSLLSATMPIGTIIDFYNYVYVRKMKQHLCKAKSIRRSCKELVIARKALQQQRHPPAADQNVPRINAAALASYTSSSSSTPGGPVNGDSNDSPHHRAEKNNRVVSPAPSAAAPTTKVGNGNIHSNTYALEHPVAATDRMVAE